MHTHMHTWLLQADALLRKNVSFQATRTLTNVILVLAPLLALGLVLSLQYTVESLVLSRNRFRCPRFYMRLDLHARPSDYTRDMYFVHRKYLTCGCSHVWRALHKDPRA
jgi:hypothetical protein